MMVTTMKLGLLWYDDDCDDDHDDEKPFEILLWRVSLFEDLLSLRSHLKVGNELLSKVLLEFRDFAQSSKETGTETR